MEEGKTMKWMEWERGVQGRWECSACWQEERRGFGVDACKARGDWRVLLLQERLALEEWGEVGLLPLGFRTPLRLKSFQLGSSLAPGENRWGLKRVSRTSRWVNTSGRRLNGQVNNDKRGKVGNDLGRGRVSSGRSAPILGRSKVSIQRRSVLLLLLEPLSTA